jgi:hypothetical protein
MASLNTTRSSTGNTTSPSPGKTFPSSSIANAARPRDGHHPSRSRGHRTRTRAQAHSHTMHTRRSDDGRAIAPRRFSSTELPTAATGGGHR